MNEKIKELSEPHYNKIEYDNGNVHECYEFSPDELVKFAELIVKECANIYDMIDNGNLVMGTDNYLKALQKHFGVEE